VREAAQRLVQLQSFDFIVILAILVSSVTLALERPGIDQETKASPLAREVGVCACV
jgi:hypothetical protein